MIYSVNNEPLVLVDAAADATMRHVRRHPKKYGKSPKNESTIFSNIEII